MPNGMSEEAQSRGHAVWEGAPCKGALYPILFQAPPEAAFLYAEIRIQPDGQKRLQYSLTFDIKIDNRQEDVISPAFCRHDRGTLRQTPPAVRFPI